MATTKRLASSRFRRAHLLWPSSQYTSSASAATTASATTSRAARTLKRSFGGSGSAAPSALALASLRRDDHRARPPGAPRGRRACPRRPRSLGGVGACSAGIAFVSAGSGSGAVSVISKKTTVMLSSPPLRFAAAISSFAAASRSSRSRLDDAEDRLVVDHRRQAVRADEEGRPALASIEKRVDVDVGIGAERAGDDRALRMDLRLLGREPAAADELGDERVVVGQLLDLAGRGPGRRASRRRGRIATTPSSTSATVIVVPMPEASAVLFARGRRPGGSPPG